MQKTHPTAESAVMVLLEQNIRQLSELDKRNLELYIPNRFLTLGSSESKSEERL